MHLCRSRLNTMKIKVKDDVITTNIARIANVLQCHSELSGHYDIQD